MPTYEYQCKTCGHHFERVQRFSDDPIKVCPECGAAVRRVIHPAGVIFKGAGWYITDSRKSGDSASLSPTNGAKPEGDAAAKTEAVESKPAETTAKAEKAPASSES